MHSICQKKVISKVACETVVCPELRIAEHETLLNKARALIDEYCRTEFGSEEGANYSDLSAVGVAYTTTEDGEHEIQAQVNLVDFSIDTFVDGTLMRNEQYSSLEEFVEKGLSELDFDDLVYVSDEELAPFYEERQNQVREKDRENHTGASFLCESNMKMCENPWKPLENLCKAGKLKA